MKRKIFRGTVKSFDEKTHTATIFISTGDIDRDQEVIEPKAFQKNLGNYMAHPVLLSSHRADTLTRQIGEARAVRILETGVEGDYEWYAGKGNPEADWGWFLVTRGIAAFSIGFIPKVWLDKWTNPIISQDDSVRGIFRRYTEIELLENSQVLVPANPNALQRRLDEAQGAEKEVLELAVKELKDQDIRPFSEAEAAQEKVNLDQKIKEMSDLIGRDEVLKILRPHIRDISVECSKELLEAFAKKNIFPKHYSEVLLDAGAAEPIRTSTENKSDNDAEDDEGKTKTTTDDDILGAVKDGVKEGLAK